MDGWVDGDETLLEASRFTVVRRRQPLAGGTARVREVVLHAGSVVVVPLLAADHVCLIDVVRTAGGNFWPTTSVVGPGVMSWLPSVIAAALCARCAAAHRLPRRYRGPGSAR